MIIKVQHLSLTPVPYFISCEDICDDQHSLADIDYYVGDNVCSRAAQGTMLTDKLVMPSCQNDKFDNMLIEKNLIMSPLCMQKHVVLILLVKLE